MTAEGILRVMSDYWEVKSDDFIAALVSVGILRRRKDRRR
jgi:hypothetical protein